MLFSGKPWPSAAITAFVINTRGHDWVNRAGDLTDFGAATYETLEDSAMDLDGALECLTRQGYKRFILVDHSLGCIKSLMYQGSRRRRESWASCLALALNNFIQREQWNSRSSSS